MYRRTKLVTETYTFHNAPLKDWHTSFHQLTFYMSMFGQKLLEIWGKCQTNMFWYLFGVWATKACNVAIILPNRGHIKEVKACGVKVNEVHEFLTSLLGSLRDLVTDLTLLGCHKVDEGTPCTRSAWSGACYRKIIR